VSHNFPQVLSLASELPKTHTADQQHDRNYMSCCSFAGCYVQNLFQNFVHTMCIHRFIDLLRFGWANAERVAIVVFADSRQTLASQVQQQLQMQLQHQQEIQKQLRT
jgi:hypothetical protein